MYRKSHREPFIKRWAGRGGGRRGAAPRSAGKNKQIESFLHKFHHSPFYRLRNTNILEWVMRNEVGREADYNLDSMAGSLKVFLEGSGVLNR